MVTLEVIYCFLVWEKNQRKGFIGYGNDAIPFIQ